MAGSIACTLNLDDLRKDGRSCRCAWMVAAFGVVVVPLGVVNIYFIIIQPIVIGT